MSEFHFIPLCKADIVTLCAQDPAVDTESFKRCAAAIRNHYHFQFFSVLETIKREYHPVNPDRDTRLLDAPVEQGGFWRDLQRVLEAANYKPVPDSVIEASLTEESLFDLRLDINFDDFEEYLVYARGISQRQEKIKRAFGLLGTRTIRFLNYDRVVLYVKFKPELRTKAANALNVPNGTLLKLFQNVPQHDLEMLFPNTTVSMRLRDKLMIGVPAAVSSGVVVFTKLGPTLLLLFAFLSFWLGLRSDEVTIDQKALVALGIGFASLGAVLWREFNKFKNRKIRFLKVLTENLYYKNLDNNQGVINYLLDSAEESECKEALLGYFMLLKLGKPVTPTELDAAVEKWLMVEHNCEVDFEVADSLRKLKELDIMEESDGLISAVPMATALERMRERWVGLMDAQLANSQ